jgi:transposase-like protein
MAQERKRKRRKFSEEYKAETVRLIRRSGKSIGQMGLELGIGETALRRWVAQAEVEAGRGPASALKCSGRESARDPLGQYETGTNNHLQVLGRPSSQSSATYVAISEPP